MRSSDLDKTGLVPNDQNMVFLTFDDWGTDETITKNTGCIESP